MKPAFLFRLLANYLMNFVPTTNHINALRRKFNIGIACKAIGNDVAGNVANRVIADFGKTERKQTAGDKEMIRRKDRFVGRRVFGHVKGDDTIILRNMGDVFIQCLNPLGVLL